MKDKVKEFYELFFRVSSENPKYRFKPTKNNEKVIDSFVNKLTGSNGDDWLFNYFCYQFSRYIDLETKFGKGIVMLNWVLGKAAFDKYKKATDEEKYWGEEFKRKYMTGVFQRFVEPVKLDYSAYKERERKRFYGTEEGLVHCQITGDLFVEESKECKNCKYKSYCDGGE